jgi:hypothetical protein
MFENLNRETSFGGHTFFRRELATFLNDIPEGGRCSFERTIRFDLHLADVGLAGDVSRHFSCLLALEGCEERSCGES